MARTVLAAAAVLATAWAQLTLTSLGDNNTACRMSSDTSQQCAESASRNCRDRYDVLTQITLADCRMVCETLAASCKGLEFLGPDPSAPNRCEVWKQTIAATAARTSYTCFNATPPANPADGALYVQFDIGTNFNWTLLSDPTVGAAALPALQSVFSSVLVTNMMGHSSLLGGSVTAANIGVSMDAAAEVASVTMSAPSPGTGILVMYALLRPEDRDFQDGTPKNANNIVTAVETMVRSVPNYASFLKAGSGNDTGMAILNRKFTTVFPTMPPTPAPTPAPTSSPTSSPAPAPGSENLARSGDQNTSNANNTRNANAAAGLGSSSAVLVGALAAVVAGRF
eukprot:CAMPEP_0175272044 /NCGR_PEP_ID=MMETSP0093-20121207/46223_1 /TAXON_ID=311494 /ORGANISM="Alexandrium monilatum, Strain CCMP3105" /LENGTH=339 /DNA_ID=CAMNT_0016566823 /DNA_START=53 /DNA_END=1072 /DNA_ORIENTATION=+